jgi:hypothetical protein
MRISGGISGGNGKNGRTPNEVYEGRNPGNESPRFEPRSRLIRGSPCTKPEEKRGLAPEEQSDEVPVPLFSAGDRLIFKIDKLEGRSHLPIISIKRAA